MKRETFCQVATDVFSFVVDEHGFRYDSIEDDVGLSVVYLSSDIRFEVNCYKGEIDEYFTIVEGNGRQIQGAQSVAAFQVWRYFLANDDARPLARYDASEAQLRQQLNFDATLIRKYCAPLFAGDIALIRDVKEKRRI